MPVVDPASRLGHQTCRRPGESDIDVIDIGGALIEQILIRSLPTGTKAALKARAVLHGRSVEAEARTLLSDALEREPITILDLLSMTEGDDIDFEPDRLGVIARTPDL